MSTVLETRLHAALATEKHTPPPTQIYYQEVRLKTVYPWKIGPKELFVQHSSVDDQVARAWLN